MYYIPLYKTIRNDGGVTVSAKRPNVDAEPVQIRIIAEDGKRVTTDGVNLYICRDVNIIGSIEETLVPWHEVDEFMNEEEQSYE